MFYMQSPDLFKLQNMVEEYEVEVQNENFVENRSNEFVINEIMMNCSKIKKEQVILLKNVDLEKKKIVLKVNEEYFEK